MKANVKQHTLATHDGPIAQGIERSFPKRCVAGSNPARAVYIILKFHYPEGHKDENRWNKAKDTDSPQFITLFHRNYPKYSCSIKHKYTD